MKNLTFIFKVAFVLSVSATSCRKSTERVTKEYHFEFSAGTQDWQPLFSDYPVGQEEFYELGFELAVLPDPLNNTIPSLKIRGNNHSDDLKSFIIKKLETLESNTQYAARFSVDIASNSCRNCVGAGGSPDLALGAGGLPMAPLNSIENVGGVAYYRTNFASALQSFRSNDTINVLGRIGVGDGMATVPFTLLNLNNNDNPMLVTSNSKGELWLVIGTDSGFEGITTQYYKQIIVVLTKI